MDARILCADGAVIATRIDPDGWCELRCSCAPKPLQLYEVSEETADRLMEDLAQKEAARHGGVAA